MKKKMKNPLPERLKQIRGGESQTTFARKLGIPQSSYSRYELGESEPSLGLLCQMARVCGVSSDWLLGLSDERSGGVSVTATGGSAVASQSPGAKVEASPAVATAAEVSRLIGIIESQQMVIARLAGVGKGEG